MNYKDYKIQKIKLGDKNYPKNLSLIKNPPKFLFSRENPNKNIFKKSIAIVGSRSITRYGKDIIDRFVSFFASQKITTISGFMYGVDSEVHKKTIEYGGLTSAVFGCGLDVIYPPENEKLYSDILNSGGMIFSEYQNNAKPHLWKFPQRNRIVSGLSSFGVLVIEAALKSGSLLTVKIAKEQGKKVYAIPGPINSTVSEGTNFLIKEGLAQMVTDPSEILGKLLKENITTKLDLTKEEKLIYDELSKEELSLDELSAKLQKSIIELSTTLSLMSIKGLVRESGGKFYI